jgi:hypothetical protein
VRPRCDSADAAIPEIANRACADDAAGGLAIYVIGGRSAKPLTCDLAETLGDVGGGHEVDRLARRHGRLAAPDAAIQGIDPFAQAMRLCRQAPHVSIQGIDCFVQAIRL